MNAQTCEEMKDKDLVKLVAKGDSQAFEELVTRFNLKVNQLAMRLTKNQEDAEEVVQDVFTTLFRKAASFEGKSAFSSWLYRVVVNAAFMKLRKKRSRPTIGIDDLSPGLRQSVLEDEEQSFTRSEKFMSNRELRRLLEHAVQRLPEQYRDVFILRDVDGLSNQEVSEILDLSIPAVKSRLHRSRLMLRKRLGRVWDEYGKSEEEQELQDIAV